MKPKDLLFPFIEREKTVFLDSKNRIFYLPSRVSLIDPPQEWLELIEGSLSCHLEIGSGNGEWICEKAQKEPNKLWFALEMRFDRVRKIWSKMNNYQLKNLWILCARAEDFLTHYFPNGSLSQISINFPDPWPKKRHAKNRLIQDSILKHLANILSADGEVDLLTDDYTYFCQMKEVFSKSSLFSKQEEKESLPLEIDEYGTSYFMRLWQEKMKKFYFLKYKNHVHNRLISLT